MTKLSKNFNSSEFECPCGKCKAKRISSTLISKLQLLRDRVGEPIYISSGIRCPTYNKKIGGHSKSPHLLGKAADIYCKNIDIYRLASKADLIFSRIGLYPDNHFIHVDILPASPSKFWVRHKGIYKYFRPPHNHYNDVYYYLQKNKLL